MFARLNSENGRACSCIACLFDGNKSMSYMVEAGGQYPEFCVQYTNEALFTFARECGEAPLSFVFHIVHIVTPSAKLEFNQSINRSIDGLMGLGAIKLL